MACGLLKFFEKSRQIIRPHICAHGFKVMSDFVNGIYVGVLEKTLYDLRSIMEINFDDLQNQVLFAIVEFQKAFHSR